MNSWLWQGVLLADWWSDMFSNLDPDKRFALLVILIGCGTGVICTVVVFISSTINSVHHRRVEAAMKRDMIERGLSAEEIAKIIEAAMPPEDATQRWIASWAQQKKSK
jgi:hypothetical protein